MSGNRLVEALNNLDPEDIDNVFGREHAFWVSPSTENLAPVKRVAIFAEAFYPKIDGVSKLAYLTLRYLQQTGREVLVFAPDIAPTHVGPSQIVRSPSVGLPFAPETRFAFPPLTVGRLLKDFEPDLIHLFSPVVLAASGMMIGRRRDIPVIANYQTDLPAYTKHYGFGYITDVTRNWLRYVHNNCHLTLVPSQYTMNQLKAEDYQRMRIWRRGVDLSRFKPQQRSEEWRQRLLNGRDPNSLLCIYVGRLATEKRVDLLLETAKLPGVALTIIGDGAARDDLEALFADTDTYFTGYIFGAGLPQAYASADVFMFPGPSETFGQVVQEAMASGLPAIIINRGGITDLVQDGYNGFACPDDPQAFATAVRTLQADPELRRLMAQRSQAEASKNPWEAIMAQLENHYREAVEMNDRFYRMHRQQPGWLRMLSNQNQQ
jgi:phosphatidylinositol alpha 1,6-mannosyltransferase